MEEHEWEKGLEGNKERVMCVCVCVQKGVWVDTQ